MLKNVIGGQLRSFVVGWKKPSVDGRIAETVGALLS